jgi:hypothetical protein
MGTEKQVASIHTPGSYQPQRQRRPDPGNRNIGLYTLGNRVGGALR